MLSQNYKNHTRYDRFYHFTLVPLILIGLVGSIICLTTSSDENRYTSSLIVFAFFILFLLAGLIRLYSLKVQDRVIKAEENFRHFTLTGKALDSNLRISQIIALRFASDAELPDLAKKAVEEKLSAGQIKQSIQQWRGDYYRV